MREIGLFDHFLRLAASEDGTVVNYSAQAKILGISPQVVKGYYEILEDTFV